MFVLFTFVCVCVSLSLSLYIYIYIYTHMHKHTHIQGAALLYVLGSHNLGECCKRSRHSMYSDMGIGSKGISH